MPSLVGLLFRNIKPVGLVHFTRKINLGKGSFDPTRNEDRGCPVTRAGGDESGQFPTVQGCPRTFLVTQNRKFPGLQASSLILFPLRYFRPAKIVKYCGSYRSCSQSLTVRGGSMITLCIYRPSLAFLLAIPRHLFMYYLFRI